MFRIDDPLAWGQEMGLPDDILAQIQAQMPQVGDPSETNPDLTGDTGADETFGFGDFAQSIFNNLNPGANFAANAWNVGTGLAEDLGFDLGPFGGLNPNANLQSNMWKTAQWTAKNVDFGSLFGGRDNGDSGENTETIGRDDGTTTLFTANGDPVEVDRSLLEETVGSEGETESADSITSGVEEMVGSWFDDILGGVSKVRSVLAGETLEQVVAQTAKSLAKRAITRVLTALAA